MPSAPHTLLQGPGGMSRYMTHANRHDWIEALLGSVQDDKMDGIADALEAKCRSMLGRIRK